MTAVDPVFGRSAGRVAIVGDGAGALDRADDPTDRADAPADPAADPLEVLWRAQYQPLVRLARLLVDDRGTAEELVQDAFVKVHGRLHAVPLERRPAYLRSAVLNGARSTLRRRQVQQKHPTTDATTAASSEALGIEGVQRDAVLGAVRGLPRRQREVLLLRYFLDLSEQEAAASLGITVGSVKTHAHRGLAALANLLEADHG